METESLGALKSAFETWRSRKRHPREATPADLLARACAAARRHGPGAVARATKVDRDLLKTGKRRARPSAATATVRATASARPSRSASTPTYSRVEVAAPVAATVRPFAEVEMPTGVKVRLFAGSTESLGLLTALLGAVGGAP